MSSQSLHLLLDQNIPQQIALWLREKRAAWRITHVKDVGLEGRPDSEIFRWAQANQAIVVTFEEDFADARLFSLGSHHGIVRLRIWPTTIEMTQAAVERLLSQVPEADLRGNLIIIDPQRIRLRRKP